MNPRTQAAGSGRASSARLALMRRELPGGYELDDDVERIDFDAVHR